MSADCVAELIKLANVRSPFDKNPDKIWEKTEANLGAFLAPDFKRLASELGPGFFGSGFHFLSPYSVSEHTLMANETLVQFRDTVKFETEPMAVKLYPDSGGLILVGFWDRQHFFIENCKPKIPSRKVVWIDFDFGEVDEFELSFSCFILRLFQGNLENDKAAELREAIWHSGGRKFFVSQ